MYKIYCLINPITNKMFYIGKTKLSLENRLKNHIAQSIILNFNEKDCFFCLLKIQGFIPIIKLLYECRNNENSNLIEKEFIQKFKKTENLLNIHHANNYSKNNFNSKMKTDPVRHYICHNN